MSSIQKTDKTDLKFFGRADAYLEWGYFSKFAHFASSKEIAVILKRKPESKNSAFLACGIHVPEIYNGHGICAFAASPTMLHEALGNEKPKIKFHRMELASPVAVSQAQGSDWMELQIPYAPPGSQAMFGVIDTGCPFANAAFTSKGLGSRVWRLWDQDPKSTGLPLKGSLQKAQPPATDFLYGGEFSNSKLNQRIRESKGDEALAYEGLGTHFLRAAYTHGGHVMDVMAGPTPVKSRISTDREGNGSSESPPSWERPDDDASSAPIVFVQIPENAVDDPTGRWLGRNVLDGLHYILACAGKDKKVVVNISWGPQTGPHDGSSLLEEAIDQLIDQRNNQSNSKNELSVVLPAGNSFAARAHAILQASEGIDELAWVVPAGQQSPSFLEIWWPPGDYLASVNLSVVAPDGTWIHLKNIKDKGCIASIGNRAKAKWGVTVVRHVDKSSKLDRVMALIALGPTFSASDSQELAPHGQWNISVDGIKTAIGFINVYVARSDANMGGSLRQGGSSFLFHPDYEDLDEPRPNKSTDSQNCPVKRKGTLSGIATGKNAWVIGGYVRSTKLAAPYTSEGDSEPYKPGIAGRLPDASGGSDESPYLPGVLAGGVRSGTGFRLIGTSTSAPQMARKILNDEAAVQPPKPTSNRDSRTGEFKFPLIETKQAESRA